MHAIRNDKGIFCVFVHFLQLLFCLLLLFIETMLKALKYKTRKCEEIETLISKWRCAGFCEMNEPKQNVTRGALDFCCCICIVYQKKEAGKEKLFCHNEMLNELKREQ